MKRILTTLIALATFVPLLSLHADTNLAEGRDYARLAAAQPGDTPGKVEVIEFFSYGCPACYQFHPHVMQWKAQLPANAVFIRVPISIGHEQWKPLAKTFYALQATGDFARLDTPLFDAIHKEGKKLFDEASITAWMTEHGVDQKKFTAAFNSFGVTSQVARAEKLASNYRVDSVPKFAVGGKYLVVGSQAKTYPEFLGIATQLVSMGGSAQQK